MMSMDTDQIDIVYFTLFPWDHPYSSVSLSITRELSRNNRVFYINHPLSLKDIYTGFRSPPVQSRLKSILTDRMRYEKIPGCSDRVIGVQPPSILPINWLPEGVAYERLHRWNNNRVLKTIRRVIADYQLKDFIFLNCYDPFYGPVLPRDTGVRLNIYQCIDDISQDHYTARHGIRLEEAAFRRADIGLVTSSRLYSLKTHFNPNLYILNNAADVDLFKRAQTEKLEMPEEIRDLKGPVIGYTGNLDDYRIDYALLRQIAEAHPDKTLLLVGPLNSPKFHHEGLHQLPNVIHTGSKPITALPAYLQCMDCVIIPFLCNELTASIYPLKINEYLAAGKSVIATRFSTDIQEFSDRIRLADSREEFIRTIPDAIQDNGHEQGSARLQRALQNSWEARVEQLWEIIMKHWHYPEKTATPENIKP